MHDRIRHILARVGNLSTPAESIPDDADLYDAGLTSFASVQLMLALEDEFEVEFPEAMLSRKTFQSIASIARSIAEIAPSEA